jgi:hypothetical protein
LKVGDVITIDGYVTEDDEYFWFVRPTGMTRAEAFRNQEHHGPFRSQAAAEADQRVVFGADSRHHSDQTASFRQIRPPSSL